MPVLGRWMRMITIPNQSSVAKGFMEFGDDNHMKPSSKGNSAQLGPIRASSNT